MNNRILVLLLFAGWSVLCWRIYVCRIKQACPNQKVKLTAITDTSKSATESSTIDKQASAIQPEESDQTNKQEAVAPVMAETKGKKTATPKESAPPTAPRSVSPEDHVTIEETADEATIHFPYNSTRKVDNDEMNAYLSKLADRLTASGEKVLVTGHTDGIGDGATNNSLALKRAQSIRDILVKKGVKSTAITCRSFGERKPVASDDTPQGRYKNRRAVITIQ
jgi:outer membrane protein OmpA-like peptidoglycan-associated protein